MKRIGNLILFVSMAACAHADTYNWKAATTGEWSVATNWVENGVPGAGDDAVVTNGSMAILSASTPLLSSVQVKGTLIFTNWDTTLNVTTLTVPTNGLITHYLNTDSNAPWVPNNRIAIACSNLTVEAGGAMNADAKGYTMGGLNKPSYGPGAGLTGYANGAGHGGPGGMQDAGYAFSSGLTYGDPFTPTNPGSAGGSHPANGLGGNGGGAIYIQAAGEVKVDGFISVNGANYVPAYGSGGSGGSVLILCDTFTGSGSIRARGGNGVVAGASGSQGGGGRISIRYGAAQSNLVAQPLVLMDVSAGAVGVFPGDMGSIWLPDTLLMRESLTNLNGMVYGFKAWSPDRVAMTNNRVRFMEDGFQLRVTNGILVSGANGSLDVGRGAFLGYKFYGITSNAMVTVEAGGDVIVTNGGTLRLFSSTAAAPDYGGLLSVTGRLAVYTNATVSLFSQATNGGSVLVRAGSVLVAASGRIEADGKGYGNYLPYAGDTTYLNMGVGPGFVLPNGGGCHGGPGARGGGSLTALTSYEDLLTNTLGSVTNPLLAGSTGGRHQNTHARLGNDGGGVVRIETTGSVFVAGAISANAGDPQGVYDGAGAGGSINIHCRTIEGDGVIRANGATASGGVGYGGGGGGGRIAVYYETGEQAAIPPQPLSFSAGAGLHGAGGWQNCVGDLGSLYFPDNRFLVSPLKLTGEWRAPGTTQWAFDSLLLSNQWFRFPEPNFVLTVTNALTVVGSTSLWYRLELSNGWLSCGRLEARGGRVGLARTAAGGSRLSCSNDLTINRGYVGVMSGGTNVMLESASLVMTNSGWLQVEAAATNPAVADQGGLVQIPGSALIGSGSWVRPLSQGTNGGSIKFVLGQLKIETNGGFEASTAGYRERGNLLANAGTGPGKGVDYGGAGYGGAGGTPNGGSAGQPYGLATAPAHAGSAGGKHTSFWLPYNYGGGVVRIQADRVTLEGTIRADGGVTGGQSYGGGGAGGSIWVRSRIFSGLSGTLYARGGNGDTQTSGAGGGGGRIALWIGGVKAADEQVLLSGQSPAGSVTNWNGLVGTVSLDGGKNSTATPRPGSAGTFFALVRSLYTGSVIVVR